MSRHCCEDMAYHAEYVCPDVHEFHESDPLLCPDRLISQRPDKSYGILVHDGTAPSSITIRYCPWCSRVLPAPDVVHPLLSQSLDELEGSYPPDAEFPTPMVEEIYRLHSVPIGELSVEDLRLLIGQRVGTEWLMPLAIERLRADPLVGGDFYRGDLLTNVLRTEPEYWESHSRERTQLQGIRRAVEERHTDEIDIGALQWPLTE